MTQTIGSTPFWTVTFDAQGDTDDGATRAVIDEIGAEGITDLVMFSHGWNNDQATAEALYRSWFGILEQQLARATTSRTVKAGLVGVYWPSVRWRDEKIPDFDSAPSVAGDTAAVSDQSAAEPTVATPEIGDVTLEELKKAFPSGEKHLDKIAGLLERADADDSVLGELLEEMKAFERATKVGTSDGESAVGPPSNPSPAMLVGAPPVVFEQFRLGMESSGMTTTTGGHDTAGVLDSVTDRVRGALNGAKEALRSLTYWQMKNRAGVVGQRGLGPLIGRLHTEAPDLRVSLVGHSFGARLVSYALAGLPGAPGPGSSPVVSVTLLEGAFSHFAFCDQLPFDRSRGGGLAGMQARINGPLVTAYSSKDLACGTFYPLASKASGQDSAAAGEVDRWGAMGHDGAQGMDQMTSDMLKSVQTADYEFKTGGVLSIDASAIVKNGGPPSGAHSDIVHPELTWLVLKAAQVVE